MKPGSSLSILIVLGLSISQVYHDVLLHLGVPIVQEDHNHNSTSSWANPNSSLTTRNPNSSLPLCSRDGIKQGRWVSNTYPQPPYISKTEHLRCHPPEFYLEHGYQTYDWMVDDCHLKPWNATEFCRLFRFSVVSIIGDSLSWEMFSSLNQLLGVRVRQSDQHKSRSQNQNLILDACNHDTRIVFRNDPYLEYVEDSIKTNFPLVLVLNRGAHYVNDTELVRSMEHIIPQLESWAESCESLGVACHLIWRTSVPGHLNCSETDKPNNDLNYMEAFIQNKSNYDNTSLDWHWYDYNHQNKLALDIIKRSGIKHTVLDAYDLNIRRPDGHRSELDCLHSCYPSSKIDVYSQLLLHFVSQQRTADDLIRLETLYAKAIERRKRLQQEKDNLVKDES
jgi:hypothetical protein